MLTNILLYILIGLVFHGRFGEVYHTENGPTKKQAGHLMSAILLWPLFLVSTVFIAMFDDDKESFNDQ